MVSSLHNFSSQRESLVFRHRFLKWGTSTPEQGDHLFILLSIINFTFDILPKYTCNWPCLISLKLLIFSPFSGFTGRTDGSCIFISRDHLLFGIHGCVSFIPLLEKMLKGSVLPHNVKLLSQPYV